jgi:hypothetical protein
MWPLSSPMWMDSISTMGFMDSDLCPAIRTARSLNPARGMIAAFPPRRSSFEIRSLIRGAFTIAAVDLRNSLLPDSVEDVATGGVYKRPTKWY